jgi:hypothetical protein
MIKIPGNGALSGLFKPNINIQVQKQIWVNYLTGKAYLEE